MTYQVRFESNAFQVDNAIGKLLDALNRTAKNVQRSAGVRLREDEVNKLMVLRGVSTRTFGYAMDWADNDFDQQIMDEKWDWKGPEAKTRRKNGQVVGEPRDIVDMGTLLRSKRREDISSSITEFNWDALHAGGVHDGQRLRSGGSNPARPWTDETLEDIQEVIQTIFERGGK